jgi:hypothetical protein
MWTIDSAGSIASQTIPSSGSALTDTSVQTTTYTASAGQNVLLNASGMQSSNTVTFSNGPNYMNYASGLPENGTEVTISNSGGSLPGGVTANTRYFITTSTGTIGSSGYTQLSLTRGGSPVDITTDGSGTNTATIVSKPISLPASPSVGNRVRFTVQTADSVRNWLPNFNGSTVNGGTNVELYRLLNVGDFVEFVCVASNAWQVSPDGVQSNEGVIIATSSRVLDFNYVDNLMIFDSNRFLVGCTSVLGIVRSGVNIRRSGLYEINASLLFGGYGTDEVYLLVYRNVTNNANLIAASVNYEAPSGKIHRTTNDVYLNAGDFVYVNVSYNNTSRSTNVTADAYRPTLSVKEVR